MSYKYILGTKDQKWFIMYHTLDATMVTNNVSQAVGVDNIEDIPQKWIENTIKNSIKFIDRNGSEMDLPFDEIVGIKIEEKDLCIFEFEVKIKYSLKELNKDIK